MTEPISGTDTGRFKNQTMINAVFAAAEELGCAGWGLVEKAGLAHLVFARQALYSGPSVQDLPNLTAEEKESILGKLSQMVPGLGRRTGTTMVRTNLHANPGADQEVLAVIPPLTSVEILEEQDDWLCVAVGGQQGYVHRAFVLPDDQRTRLGFLRSRPELADIPLEPPEAEVMLAENMTHSGATVLASVWNRYGGLLVVLASLLKIDPAVAVAVFVTESPGGRGFSGDGRMIIRFENHIFFDKWGKRDPARFAEHFRFNAQQRWRGHQWRAAPDQPWRDFHGNQDTEWIVFQFARSLDETAAKLSISMGAPQVMGFNYAALGYESVHEMFDAFSSSERSQIFGFFDFVKGPSAESRRIQALQQQDFESFAALYNGTGQAAIYAGLIESRTEMFRKLRVGEPIPRSTPGILSPPPPEEAVEPLPELAQARSGPPAAGLDEEWQKQFREAIAQTNAVFRRALVGITGSYAITSWAYRILMAVGVAFAVAAIGFTIWTSNAGFALVFGGLSVAAFLAYFLSRSLRSVDENPEIITWLGVVYNTYWARLANLINEQATSDDLVRVHREAADEVERIMQKRLEMKKGR